MAAGEPGPSLVARLLFVLLGLSFLGAAWVWSHRSERWAGQMVDRARETVGR